MLRLEMGALIFGWTFDGREGLEGGSVVCCNCDAGSGERCKAG